MGWDNFNRPDWDYNSASGVGLKSNLKEYNKSWKIYELSRNKNDGSGETPTLPNDPNNFVSESEFVAALTDPNLGGSALIHIVESKDFVDENTGNIGTLFTKPDLSEATLDFQSRDYLQKFLFKNTRKSYTFQEFPQQNKLYFVSEGEPKIDELGIIKSPLYFVFSRARVPKLNGEFYETEIVFSFIDGNVIENPNFVEGGNQSRYLNLKFITKSIKPTNCRYIKFTPKTKVAITPKMVNLLVDDGLGGSFNLEPRIITEGDKSNGLLAYNVLDLWMDEKIGYSIKHHSTIGQEYRWAQQFHQALQPSNVVNDDFRVVIGYTNNFKWPWFNNGNFVDGDYTQIWNSGSIFATNDFTENFIEYWSDFRLGGGYSQLDPADNISFEDGFFVNEREIANWKNSNTLFYWDIYRNKYDLVLFKDLYFVLSEPVINTGKITNQKNFVKDFLRGELSLGNIAINQPYPAFADTSDFTPNIRNYSGNGNKFVMINGQNYDEVYDKTNWTWYENFLVLEGSFSRNTILRLPNPDQTFAVGMPLNIEKMNEATNKGEIYFDLIDERIINQFNITVAHGSFEIEFLDNNFKQCVGVNGDGDQNGVPALRIPSIQKLKTPFDNKLTINYL